MTDEQVKPDQDSWQGNEVVPFGALIEQPPEPEGKYEPPAEPGEQPGEQPASDDDAPVVDGKTMKIKAQLISVGGTTTAKGRSAKARFEVDAVAGAEVFSLLGQKTVLVTFQRVTIGQATVANVSGKPDADAVPRAHVDLLFPENEYPLVKKLWVMLGAGGRLELEQSQGEFDLTARAE